MVPLDLDYVPPSDLGPALSYLVAVVLGPGVGGCMFSVLLEARKLTRAKERERAAYQPGADAPLHVGPRRVVRGVVEPEEGRDVAFKVEVTQEANDHTSKSRKWHTWDEVGRNVEASPFYLVRADGESVLVEPDHQALVVDHLETVASATPRQRLRTCDLRRGETFSAHGDLRRGHHPRARGGYRGDGLGWILRAPRDGTRMLFATAAIVGRYKQRVTSLRWWGGLSLVVWMIFHAFTTVPFLAASVLGREATATMVGRRVTVTTHKRSRTSHYLVTVEAGDVAVEREVPIGTYQTLVARFDKGERSEVPLTLVGSSTWAAHLGRRASIGSYSMLIGAVVICLFGGLIFWARYTETYAWYDRKRVCEHGGDGHFGEVAS